MFDHLTLNVRALAKSRTFYAAALAPLGIVEERGENGSSFGPKGAMALYVTEGKSGAITHLAFSAPNRKSVDAFHEAALAAGAKCNGEPGLRKDYGPSYYAAFVIDPDGNNVEAVCHARG
jgi:catechol 2,3-dioxygenase-like lactoylglutathione lyase family enzyme